MKFKTLQNKSMWKRSKNDFFFGAAGDWSLYAVYAVPCTAGTSLLVPHLQSILLWLFWRWGCPELFARAGIKLWSSQSQDSQVSRIIGRSHQYPAQKNDFLEALGVDCETHMKKTFTMVAMVYIFILVVLLVVCIYVKI
jgi:hypothetical protein